MAKLDKQAQILIAGSRYRPNLESLYANPSLGKETIFQYWDGWNLRLRTSNCFGTLAYVCNIEDLIKDYWEQTSQQLGLIPDNPSYLFLPKNRPGYILNTIFESFLANHAVETEKKKDNIVVFYWSLPPVPPDEQETFELNHCALYLGQNIIFHQRTLGKEFTLTKIKDFKQTLCQRAQQSLETRCYKLK